MSRVWLESKDETKTVVIGLDHVMGYFFQLFGEDIDSEENVLMDEDFVSQGQMIALIEEHAVQSTQTKQVIAAIACDLDPGVASLL